MSPPPSPASPPVVLVVENDRALRESLEFAFELDGYRVSTFETAETLLAAELPADNACLVVDEVLPRLSGPEALAELRARGVALPAVILTSHARASLHVQALMVSAQILEKPLLGDALYTLVRNLLSVR